MMNRWNGFQNSTETRLGQTHFELLLSKAMESGSEELAVSPGMREVWVDPVKIVLNRLACRARQ
jgi:hypothetical protein